MLYELTQGDDHATHYAQGARHHDPKGLVAACGRQPDANRWANGQETDPETAGTHDDDCQDCIQALDLA